MSNTPHNPNDPSPSEKGPWVYSGTSQPTYTPPTAPSLPPEAKVPFGGTSTPVAATSSITDPPARHPATQIEPKQDDASLASIIDTIEAIVIALVLALTFRAFIIEAFVIPTGSMAPTLLGAHFNVTCPQCGYDYRRDASLQYQIIGERVVDKGSNGELTSNSNIPADTYYEGSASLICPNCHYRIPYTDLPQYLGETAVKSRPSMPTPSNVPVAWANNGDRILVLKYVYSLLEPSRFDVIVFKEPMGAQYNYIKRLIALPGETVEIINGDIFIAAPGKTDPADRVIARKPAHIQRDVWQLVYDNDYYPRDEGMSRVKGLEKYFVDHPVANLTRWQNPWVGTGDSAEAWNRPSGPKTVGGPIVEYRSKAPGTLKFNPAHRSPYAFNTLGYNNDIHDLYTDRQRTLFPASDLRLETTWTPAESNGATISLTVGAQQNLFRTTWSPNGIQLAHYNPTTKTFDSVQLSAVVQTPPTAKTSYNVAMNNVDHAVQFFIDGKLIFNYELDWNAKVAREQSKAVRDVIESNRGKVLESMDDLAPRIEIDVAGECQLAHLKLFRDLYYTQTEKGQPRYPGAANTDFPLTLNEDEFFALGDNSRKSHDGRTWDHVYPALDDLGTRRGVVPRRYLLGKAVFVYWPAGFRFSDRFNAWPLVPNTGDMRFIR
jgi:signal peptidase I